MLKVRGTRVWTTLALVIAGGFVVSPTAAASDGTCKGEGGVEEYVEMEDPLTFETSAHGEYTIASYTPSDEPDRYHYWWTTFDCGHMLEAWLECAEEAGPANALEQCRA